MREIGDRLTDSPNLEHFVLSMRFDGFGSLTIMSIGRAIAILKRVGRMNHLLIKTLVEWHNVEVFTLPHCDLTTMYVSVPDCWVSWEPSRLLSMQSPSIFLYYCGLMLCGF